MTTVVLVIHVIVCVTLVISVLLQTGKGAELGAAFGGASKAVFGPRGAAGPLAKMTIAAAVLFMLTSLYLTWDQKHRRSAPTVTPPSPTAPAQPVTTPPTDTTVPTPNEDAGAAVPAPANPGGNAVEVPVTIPDLPEPPAETTPTAPPPTSEPGGGDKPGETP